MTSIETTMSEKFNKPDVDITFKSNDGVLFALHKKNLASHTGGFPPAATNTENEVVELSEPSDVLELLFQFVYPEVFFTNLENIPFELFERLVQAAEKYIVYIALVACRTRMLSLVQRYNQVVQENSNQKHPYTQSSEIENMKSIFKFAVAHSYTEVIDEAAPFVISEPLQSIMPLFPLERQASWVFFREWWIDLHRRAYAQLLDIIAKKNHGSCSCWSPRTTEFKLEDMVSLGDFTSRVPSHCRDYITDWKSEVQRKVNNLKIQTKFSSCEKPF